MMGPLNEQGDDEYVRHEKLCLATAPSFPSHVLFRDQLQMFPSIHGKVGLGVPSRTLRVAIC
jgi:hypothetical protein